jgi:hypothetical protein
MESFFSEIMLPGNDVSSMLMSPGLNKQDVIRFDQLMQAGEQDGIRIVSEPEIAAGRENEPKDLAIEAFANIEKLQATTQNHMSQVLKTLNQQDKYEFLNKKNLKLDQWEVMEKMHHAMQAQATNLLKTQMHMNLYSVTVSIVNRVANNVNEGIKTLYRQQG